MSGYARFAEPLKIPFGEQATRHLISGTDRYRTVCGVQLSRYEERYVARQAYRTMPQACARCAAYLSKTEADVQDPARKHVIERIRKLLALAGSPNEAEGALASERARELLNRHNLSMGVAENTDDQPESVEIELEGRSQPYYGWLAHACDGMFDVQSLLYRKRWKHPPRVRGLGAQC